MNTKPGTKNWDSSVAQEVDRRLEDLGRLYPNKTRAELALILLSFQEGWFTQTPEGQYLEHIAHGGK